MEDTIHTHAQRMRCNPRRKPRTMGECNKNKGKTHEERWHVTAYDGRRSGGTGSNGFGIESVVRPDSIDGFDGWMDTDIGWRYDWYQRTINRAYHVAKPANA